jgi:hypothetical protein
MVSSHQEGHQRGHQRARDHTGWSAAIRADREAITGTQEAISVGATASIREYLLKPFKVMSILARVAS